MKIEIEEFDSSFIETLDCSDADEFFEALRIDSPKWYDPGKWGSDWIFRGVGSESFDLTPTAWRAAEGSFLWRTRETSLGAASIRCERWLKRNPGRGPEISSQEFERFVAAMGYALAEELVIWHFFDVANQVGHPVPHDHLGHPKLGYSAVGTPWESQLSDLSSVQFVDARRTSVGLARHHGIPGRVVDWTKDPMIAALFAVLDASRKNRQGKLCVYAINYRRLNPTSIAAKMVNGFQCFTPPGYENPYLQAQKGVLVFASQPDRHFIERGRFPSVESTFGKHLSPERGDRSLVRILISGDCREELERRLSARGISEAHLKPTYDNVLPVLERKFGDIA